MTELEFYTALERAFEAGIQFATDNPNLSSPTHCDRVQDAWEELMEDPAIEPIFKSFEG